MTDQPRKSLSERQSGAHISVVKLVYTEAPERMTLIDRIVQLLREHERLGPRGASFACARNTVHQRPAQRGQQPHARACIVSINLATEAGERTLGLFTAFTQ